MFDLRTKSIFLIITGALIIIGGMVFIPSLNNKKGGLDSEELMSSGDLSEETTTPQSALSTENIVSLEKMPISKNISIGKSDSVDYKNIETYGRGDLLVEFVVKVPEWTPEEDKIVVRIENGDLPSAWLPMEEIEDNVWVGRYNSSEEIVRYKYSRNYEVFLNATDEQFTPDNVDQWRTLTITDQKAPMRTNDVVEGWRWLQNPPPQANISTFRPISFPARDRSFVFGVNLIDYYYPELAVHVPATMKKISVKGYQYVGIVFQAGTIESLNPLIVTDHTGDSFKLAELDFLIKEARKNNLQIILTLLYEINPELGDVDNGFREVDWYQKSGERRKEIMLSAAQIAERYEIEILSPTDTWFDPNMNSSVKKVINNIASETLSAMNTEFSGILTTDKFTDDSEIDYYKNLDWIGYGWWYPMTQNRNPTIADMKASAEEILVHQYKPISDKFGKPIFIGQFAYSSYDGSAGAEQVFTEGPKIAEWFNDNPSYPSDFQEQADVYEAVLQAIYDEPYIAGIASFGYKYWDSHDKSVGIRSKPAEDVFVKWNDIFND